MYIETLTLSRTLHEKKALGRLSQQTLHPQTSPKVIFVSSAPSWRKTQGSHCNKYWCLQPHIHWHFYFVGICLTIYNQKPPLCHVEASEICEFTVGRFSDSYLHITHKIITPERKEGARGERKKQTKKETKCSQSWHKVNTLLHYPIFPHCTTLLTEKKCSAIFKST